MVVALDLTTGRPILPATSQTGALRAVMARAVDVSDADLDALFGGPGSLSPLRPYDAVADTPLPATGVRDGIAIDPATGTVSDKTLWKRWPAADGVPDGMTTDAQGRLWVAHWGGSCVTCHDADTAEELQDQYPDLSPKSLTFIASSYKDNAIGMAKDPKYIANLDALTSVEREQLKLGNWKIRAAAGDYFKAEWFKIVERAPDGCRWVRYWDRAATEPNPQNTDPDYTAGVKLGKDADGNYYVGHVARDRKRPAGVKKLIKGTAQADGVACTVGIEQDPAQAGKFEADDYVRFLAGFEVRPIPPQGDKEVRARPASAQAEQGNIYLVRGPWNKAFLDELEAFPKGGHDDQVDGLSGAFNFLESSNVQPAAGATVEAAKSTYDPQSFADRQQRGVLQSRPYRPFFRRG